jgi:hypothetical protein
LNQRTGGFLGRQIKFQDTYLQNSAIPTPSTAFSSLERDPTTENCLFAPVQGNGESNRDGKRVKVMSVAVEGNIHYPYNAVSTNVADHWVFLALVQDKQTNGAQLNSEDVYTKPSGQTMSNQDSMNPLRNMEFTDRFKVLAKRKIRLKPEALWNGTNMSQQATRRCFSLRKKFKKCPIVHFTGNSGTVASVVDNSFHVLAWDSDHGSSAAALLSYNARTRFIG